MNVIDLQGIVDPVKDRHVLTDPATPHSGLSKFFHSGSTLAPFISPRRWTILCKRVDTLTIRGFNESATVVKRREPRRVKTSSNEF